MTDSVSTVDFKSFRQIPFLVFPSIIDLVDLGSIGRRAVSPALQTPAGG